MKSLVIKSKEPVVLVTVKEYESMKETIEVLSDKILAKQLRNTGIARRKGGKPSDFEKVKKKAGF